MNKTELNLDQIANANGGIIGGLAGTMIDAQRAACAAPVEIIDVDSCIHINLVKEGVKLDNLANPEDFFHRTTDLRITVPLPPSN